MSKRRRTKYALEGQYAAAVDVDWIEFETGWSPCLSLEDAQKLDEVREALRVGDLKRAGQLGEFTSSPLLLFEPPTLIHKALDRPEIAV